MLSKERCGILIDSPLDDRAHDKEYVREKLNRERAERHAEHEKQLKRRRDMRTIKIICLSFTIIVILPFFMPYDSVGQIFLLWLAYGGTITTNLTTIQIFVVECCASVITIILSSGAVLMLSFAKEIIYGEDPL